MTYEIHIGISLSGHRLSSGPLTRPQLMVAADISNPVAYPLVSEKHKWQGYNSPYSIKIQLFKTKLQAICQTDAHLLIQIIRNITYEK